MSPTTRAHDGSYRWSKHGCTGPLVEAVLTRSWTTAPALTSNTGDEIALVMAKRTSGNLRDGSEGTTMPGRRKSDVRVFDLASWLAGPARVGLTPVEIVAQTCERLVQAGIPLWRVRLG